MNSGDEMQDPNPIPSTSPNANPYQHVTPRQILELRCAEADKRNDTARQIQHDMLFGAFLQKVRRNGLSRISASGNSALKPGTLSAPAHANIASLANDPKACQDRIKIINAIRQTINPSPMPKEVRDYRLKHGLPVPDPNTPFIIVNPNDNNKKKTKNK